MTPEELERWIERARVKEWTEQERLETQIEQGRLEGWRALDLANWGLTQLPDALWELTMLEELDLSGNELRELPAAIGKLVRLRSLKLVSFPSGSQLSQLPAEISQLSNLIELDLRNNNLSQLPAEIGQLSNLVELNLRNNRLSQLPAEISQLSNLIELDLNSNQLSQLPAEIGQLSNLVELDLRNNQLSQLPAEIGQLIHLTKLYLRGNQLSQLPAEIGQLSNLTELVLSGNQLSQLPAEIGQLIHLTKLYLNDNQLSQLPAEIGQLSNLTELVLSGNQLSQLPTEVSNLTHLTKLSLSGNQLSQLPAEIVHLTHLTYLSLHNNHLSQLPAEVSNLTHLTKLSLSGNQLSQLPAEIVQLTHLTYLSLHNNHLSQLPAEIAQLTHLTSLSLHNNQLSQLPAEIGQLSKLTELYLNNNTLSQLPAEIAQLSNLISLSLNNNTLSQLPAKIAQLIHLTWLDLRYNPLPIPPEILRKHNDPATILNFYTEYLTGQKQRLNEAKLLIVGQGSVGKTSLVNRLLHDRFNPHENKTEGISINSWQVEKIHLNVWDFGGQEIMHATHQFFLTKRSLYLLVLDTRLREEENRLDYWLKIIQSFGGNSPAIVVGNKTDQQALDLDQRGLQGKYPNIKAFVETSCRNGQGINTLKATITQEVNQLEHVKDELPLNWFDLKTQLAQIKRDYIPYPEYVQLCQKKGIHNEQSQQTLIGFLHDLGVVLNFRDDPRLKDTNILNPAWVTNGVYQILNDNALMTQHKGILDRTLLDRILDSTRYPRNKQLFIVAMMRKFELCFDLEPNTQFLIPDLLSKEEPDTGTWDDALAFQYHYTVLPGSIMSRFIVRTHPLLSKNSYWRSGAVLAHEGSRALVKADREDKKIFIWVTGTQAKRRNLLTTIRTQFEAIHQTIPGIEAIEKVPLPNCPDITVSYDHLLTLEENNILNFIPDGSKQPVSVKQLLDGVELMRSQQQDPNPIDPDRAINLRSQNLYGSIDNFSNPGISQPVDRPPNSTINTVQETENQLAQEQLPREDIIDLLNPLINLIQDNQALDEADRKKVGRYLDTAKTELEEEEEPDTQWIAKNLERTAKILKDASTTVAAGKSLWNQAQPILMRVCKGLSIAAHF